MGGTPLLRVGRDLLAGLPLAERELLPGLSSDRADIILPGALALAAVMDALPVDRLTISCLLYTSRCV